MENEKEIYTEVYTVLSRLPQKYIEYIPRNVLNEIFNKADTTVTYEVVELHQQSKAIIAEIIRNYFKDEEINNKIDEYINYIKSINK